MGGRGCQGDHRRNRPGRSCGILAADHVIGKDRSVVVRDGGGALGADGLRRELGCRGGLPQGELASRAPCEAAQQRVVDRRRRRSSSRATGADRQRGHAAPARAAAAGAAPARARELTVESSVPVPMLPRRDPGGWPRAAPLRRRPPEPARPSAAAGSRCEGGSGKGERLTVQGVAAATCSTCARRPTKAPRCWVACRPTRLACAERRIAAASARRPGARWSAATCAAGSTRGSSRARPEASERRAGSFALALALGAIAAASAHADPASPSIDAARPVAVVRSPDAWPVAVIDRP